MRLVPLLAVALCAALPALAQPTGRPVHALSLVEEPKYGPDFRHLDYVNPDAPKGGELKLADIGGFDSTNPFIIRGEAAPGIGLIYETLMASPQDDVSAEYAAIAESVEIAPDWKSVTFRLRPEARFHDGKPITAEDAVFSLETLKTKGAPFYRFYYGNVERAEAVDARTVRFHFSGPKNRELPVIMGQLPVLPKHWWATRDFDRTTLEAPLGSGPYRVAQLEANRFIVYERVADWWARDLPLNRGRYNFQTVRYDMYRDSTVAVEALKGGQYHLRAENVARNWATAYDIPAVQEGRLIKKLSPSERPQGMQAFVFNTRRAKFGDARVRHALAHAFDFEWTNKTLFFGQYTRTTSYFQNSPFAATTLPTPDELKLLEPLRGQVPPEVFTKVYAPPATDGSGELRENLRTALGLLREAGWTIRDRRLTSPTGEPMQIEILNAQPDFERVILPFIRNLERLGVSATVRTVDTAQYTNRVRAFDYDMIIGGWPQSNSPGNEQRDFWSSSAAERNGSRNTAGIRNPAVDALVDRIIAAESRDELLPAVRALDRVLLWNHYVIPNWFMGADRLVYWNRFGMTGRDPKYGADIYAWWVDPTRSGH